jgi:hypothetical protein
MAYVAIDSFRFGVDWRRPRYAAVPGTLYAGKNVHISRGGDVERAKKFVSLYSLPTGTFGLGQINGQLWVFGSADLAASMPAGVQYQRLQLGSAAMTRVLSNRTYDNKHYVIAEYDDGNIGHFYNGTRITNLDSDANAGADSIASYVTLADYMARKLQASSAVKTIVSGANILVEAIVPGVPFTLSSGTVDGGGTNDQVATVTTLQANVTAQAEVRATGTVTITGGTTSAGVNTIRVAVNGVQLTAAPVNFISSNNATAAAVVVAVNNHAAISGYTASAVGAAVTLRAAPGTGATPNGHVVAATLTGDVTASTANMAGGSAAAAAVAQIMKVAFGGTFEPADQFTLTLNGVAYVGKGRASGYGTFAAVYKRRVFQTANSLLRYSKLGDPSDVTDASTSSGAGFINLSNDSEGSERLVSIAPYQTYLAIFSRRNVRVYDINTDAALNEFRQELENTGTFAPRSVITFGNTDVFYLDDTGIRSLQVRDVTNAAFVADAGSAIDPLVAEWLATLSIAEQERAVAVIEPTDGRFMLAVGNRIFVLSFFPSSKVNAWSYYEPGFTVTDFVRSKRELYARDAGTIYLYGGKTGNVYPGAGEQAPVLSLPFITAQSAPNFKKWTGIDLGATGTWKVEMLLDPRDETKKIEIARVDGVSYGLPDIAGIGEWPMFAFDLTCTSAGFASISNVVAHYEPTRVG